MSKCLLSKGETEKVLIALKKQGVNKSWHNDILLLNNQFARIKGAKLLNIKDKDDYISVNNIVLSILEILSKISKAITIIKILNS